MRFSKKELVELYRGIMILERGDELLGIDVDLVTVNALASKLKRELPAGVVVDVGKQIESVIEESAVAFNDDPEDSSPRDFDEAFGPSYPTRETVKVLEHAIEKKSAVKIRYYSASRGEFTERVVEPEGLERRGGKLYLDAFCRLRNDGRVFRVDRIKHIKEVHR